MFSESYYNTMSRQFSNKIRPSKSASDYQRRNQHLVLNGLIEFGDNESVDSEKEISRIERRSLEKEVSSLKHQLFNSGGIVSLDQLLEAEGKLKDAIEENANIRECVEGGGRERKGMEEKKEEVLSKKKDDLLLDRVLAIDFDKDSDEESLVIDPDDFNNVMYQ